MLFLVLWQGLSTYLSFLFLLFLLCGPPGWQSPLFDGIIIIIIIIIEVHSVKKGNFFENSKINFFSWIFPIIINLYCLQLIFSKCYFNLLKVFVWQLFKMPINQTVFQTWIEVCHQISACWEVQSMWNLLKNVLVQKMFTNWLKMGLSLWTCVKKAVHGVETHWLFGKEKVLATVVSKDGHADTREVITINFLEEVAIVNNASYCQILQQYFTFFIEWLLYKF